MAYNLEIVLRINTDVTFRTVLNALESHKINWWPIRAFLIVIVKKLYSEIIKTGYPILVVVKHFLKKFDHPNIFLAASSVKAGVLNWR